jgi:hypothetical protein
MLQFTLSDLPVSIAKGIVVIRSGYPDFIVATAIGLLLAFATANCPGQNRQPELVTFNRDIRPILSDKCFVCHGNDSSSREAGMRLDRFDDATAETESGVFPVVPGDPDASELLRRVSSDDESERMPPSDSHRTPLTPAEVALLRKWIEQGAAYQPHWAFIAPTRVDLETLPNSEWCRNPIDRFVWRRLVDHQLQPAPAADRRTLIRRVTLDLTGLPPTPDQVRDFLNDRSPDAYEALVDRLLASPAYGENMTRFWLDAARYGDTHGLHLDNYREIWPWRDWVIRAFNANMPWDDFTVRQLAGDLLPDATTDDLIASGFNRLHVTTNEGGAIPEEVFVRNVVDRVSTTGTVFMGMTFGCAVCHDHKYDPISSQDFYSIYAFFNSLDDNPMDGNAKDHAPVIKVMGDTDQGRHDEMLAALDSIRQQLAAPDELPTSAENSWRELLTRSLVNDWQAASVVSATSSGNATLSIVAGESGRVEVSGENPPRDRYEIVLEGPLENTRMLRLEVLPAVERPQRGGGRSENGNAVLSEVRVFFRKKDDADAGFVPLKVAEVTADYSQPNYDAAAAIDGIVSDSNGWAIDGHKRFDARSLLLLLSENIDATACQIKLQLEFQSQFAQHSFANMRFSTGPPPPLKLTTFSEWYSVGPFPESDAKVAYETDYGPETAGEFDVDRSFANPVADGPALKWQIDAEIRDGTIRMLPQEVGVWYFYRRVVPQSGKLKLSLGSDDALAVWVNGERKLDRNVARGVAADQDVVEFDVVPDQPNELLFKIVNFGGAAGFYFRPQLDEASVLQLYPVLVKPADERTADENSEVHRVYLAQNSPQYRALLRQEQELGQELATFESSLPTTLVSRELEMPRPAYLLKRGEYDKPDMERGALSRRVPAWLPPFPESEPVNRLGFARWLVLPEHPLLARVTVNRFWMQLFGKGIVKTAEDFGAQGAWPTHPELLDYLAVDFRESGWDVKRLLKQMVMSATYCQSSNASPENWAADPTNRWLSRGPRYRLDAEMLRDQALLASGLLVEKIGGPGVKPPQPAGIWEAVGYVGSNTQNFVADMGHDKVHRRSLYTFWKRTAPPPQLSTFDAPSREECVIRRERTNTPLQALLMLNDPQYVECAKALAARCLGEAAGSTSPEAPIANRMFELATARPPEEREQDALVTFYNDRLSFYAVNKVAATALLAIGEPLDGTDELDKATWAAWTAVANVVLNLDEVVSKQ